ncbi:MAG: alpha-D-ribose 1-methylphosphonate 5-triphosphate diphosphatase [Acidobacteria bacterium]|nr:alpha-D-ribose 1-methylphosphonate 5-triphosphate diphosphatase [Acidobacteriota bacterium]
MSLLFTNARLVTPEALVSGSLLVEGETIAAVDASPSSLPRAVDCEGDLLLPGLVEVHTDHFEIHLVPRPSVRWPPGAALAAHDAQIAGAGITTVFDSISLGTAEDRSDLVGPSVAAIRAEKARDSLRADHYIHLRCEIVEETTVDLFAPYKDDPLLRMVSLMDHTPGQRQWQDLEKYHKYYAWRLKATRQEIEERIAEKQAQQQFWADRNQRRLLEMVADRDVALASHDDTEPEHVAEAAALGLTISEFPTTERAARAARELGLGIVLGAPNVVLGGSHSGNVSALELAKVDLLDALASDYVPVSLLHGAFLLHEQGGLPLPRAVATVTANPAKMGGLADRGRLQVGLRADLLRVRWRPGERPQAVEVWRAGRRVA